MDLEKIIEVLLRKHSSFKKVEIDKVTTNLYYVGFTNAEALTSDPSWLLVTVYRNGKIAIVEYGNSSASANQVWDDRVSIFGDPDLLNQFSLSFDGINDRVSFGDSFSDMDVSTQWSMSFWVNINNLAAQRCIYSKATDDLNVYGFNIQVTTAGKLFIQARSASYSVNYTGGITIPTQEWVHVTVTYAGGNNFNGIKVYINGVADTPGSSAAMSTSLHSGQTAYIGSRNTAFPFSGYIDEVSFWNKALSQSEITEIYNSGQPTDATEHSFSDALTHYWRMGDGDLYPFIADHAGSVNGQMINMLESSIVEVVP